LSIAALEGRLGRGGCPSCLRGDGVDEYGCWVEWVVDGLQLRLRVWFLGSAGWIRRDCIAERITCGGNESGEQDKACPLGWDVCMQLFDVDVAWGY